MELLQLKYFLALARAEHVSKTAASLHISQPSLSLTIKKLEKELGVPLFEREGRNIRLSEYGHIYKEYAEEVFTALENGQRALQTKKGINDRYLPLGILSPYIWKDLLHQFHQAYPDIIVNRYSMESDNYIKALSSGKIDMYLGGLNYIPFGDELECITLYEDDMVLLVNKNHPLANQTEVDLRYCAGEHFINLGQHTNLQQFINTFYQLAGFSPKVVMECDYTLRDQMVIDNYGVSVTTRTSCESLDSDQVTALSITYPEKKRMLGLVYRKKVFFTPPMEAFLKFAKEYYAVPAVQNLFGNELNV